MNEKQSKSAALSIKELVSRPKARCSKCNKVKSYLNPVKICCSCKKNFCLDELWAITWTNGVIHVCDGCKEEHHYHDLGPNDVK